MEGDTVRLLSIAYPAHETIRGVQFAMLDMGELVHVIVTRSALDKIEATPLMGGQYVARFQRHRERLEGVADQKYARGQMEDDGSIAVLPSDLVGTPS